MSFAPDLTSRVIRHERLLVSATIVLLAALCWWYVAAYATAEGSSSGMGSMREAPLGTLVVMWCLMMIAMMLPSATPAILLYSRVRNVRNRDSSIAQTWVFVGGYLAVWLMFSIAAALAQKALGGPSMALQNRFAEAAILVAAGLFQLSPIKSACLSQCRSPAEFLTRHWRPRWNGAIELGVRHGVYCLGCCWMLMALLFVGGIMNLLWVAALTLVIAGEKLLPMGQLIGRALGVALVFWGAAKLLLGGA